MATRIPRLIKLGPAQYAVPAATVLVILPVIVWIVVGDSIYWLYVEQVVAPRLRNRFGFEVGWVHVGPGEAGEGRWHTVTKVTPGGAMERAGVRRGDTGCLGVDTGGIGDIYAALELLDRQPEVVVLLSNAAEGRQPCRSVTIRR